MYSEVVIWVSYVVLLKKLVLNRDNCWGGGVVVNFVVNL